MRFLNYINRMFIFIVLLTSNNHLFAHNEEHYSKIWWYNRKAHVLPIQILPQVSNLIEKDFERSDLSGLTLAGYWLSESNLKHSNLNNVTIKDGHFYNTDLQYIRGENSVIEGNDFRKAKFQHASLRKIKVSHGYSTILHRMDGPDLGTDSTEKIQVIEWTSFEEARFDYADLEKSIFEYSKFKKASFRGAILIGSNLTKEKLLAEECDITDAIFDEDIVDGVTNGSLYKTEFLIKKGISTNVTNSEGKTLLCIALTKGFDEISVLLITKSLPLPLADDEGMTWVHFAAKNSLNKALNAGLAFNKDQINSKNNLGNTPVHYAALNGNTTMIDTLHKAGASLNEKNNDGLTPLHLAIMNKRTSVIEILAQLGATKNVKTALGFSEVHLAFEHNYESLVPVLAKHKFDLDAQSDSGETAMHIVTKKGEKRFVQLLKDNGARVNIRDKTGKLPVFWGIKARRDSLSKLLELDNEKPTFKDVLGVDSIALGQVKAILDYMRNPYKYKIKGAPQPTRILLIGPPGTGKTLIARALSNEANCAFLERSGSSFIERWVGAPTENIKNFLEEARKKAPCIVFIDEFDAISGHRKDPKDSGSSATDNHNQMINQLLCDTGGFTESKGLIIIGATNHIKNIDKAIRSRFTTQIHISLPDKNGRFDILKHFINTLPSVRFDDDYIKHLAQITDGFSGRTLKALVSGAALLSAVKEEDDPVTIEDFKQSFAQITRFDDEKESD